MSRFLLMLMSAVALTMAIFFAVNVNDETPPIQWAIIFALVFGAVIVISDNA